MGELQDFLRRVRPLLERVERLLPDTDDTPDWRQRAFRWRPAAGGRLEAVEQPHQVALDELLCLDAQKDEVVRNTAAFVAGRPANNVLLWGSRGTGKSTLVKAVFNHFADQGLRLIEVDKAHLVNLPDIVKLLNGRDERFLIYCDDLSFEAGDASYKALKATLEGSIAAPPQNVLIYATSNRRHLLPEFHSENRQAQVVDGELHHGEATEEKISLSERFGLWLSFYPFSQEQYLSVADYWLARLGAPATGDPAIRALALQWATQRGSRSGRVAKQFAIDQAGRIT